MNPFLVFAFTFVVTISTQSYADSGGTLDSASQGALKSTQDLLTNKKQREDATQEGDAKKADDYVRNLTDNDKALSDDVYKMASEIFPALVKKANGDPKKMKEIIDQFSRDPASFAGEWTPEQREKLHELSLKLPQPINNKN